jgi:hypothetical protein
MRGYLPFQRNSSIDGLSISAQRVADLTIEVRGSATHLPLTRIPPWDQTAVLRESPRALRGRSSDHALACVRPTGCGEPHPRGTETTPLGR